MERPFWLQHVLWSLLYGAWMHSRADRVSLHEALTLCMGALAKVVAP
ncbi:hypothetical protein [Nonomuraea sp. B19D2]